jgi:hypothetical protein
VSDESPLTTRPEGGDGTAGATSAVAANGSLVTGRPVLCLLETTDFGVSGMEKNS